ncbi:arrestin domain-containing protein [Colletotrichum kahawae]|uniref:Arrestin domain-containing protein n=1 Tax=Colletotrichum kahawae TaxID=34407 RepID=A0AAE0D248_COLKA|nr:arrestin domain-containing protein [Colletotrichum kahawae]
MQSINKYVSSKVDLAGFISTIKEITIIINGHFNSKVYTCGSVISGTVLLTPRRSIPFSHIKISFIGKTNISFEDAYISKDISQRLLTMDFPISASSYPESQPFQVGQTYNIPFFFIIPHQLTDSICVHGTNSHVVRNNHLRLPSTLAGWEKDDLAPRFTKIEYHVWARISHQRGTEVGGDSKILSSSEHRINVLTTYPEDPPLSIRRFDTHYTPSQSKLVRRKFFSGSLGRITATAAQPHTMRLDPYGRSTDACSYQVTLIFEPSSPTATPPLDVSLSSVKLLTRTWYSSQPAQDLPDTSSTRKPLSISTKVTRLSFQFGAWRSTVTSPTPLEDRQSGTIETYIALLQVGFRLPTSTHIFPPTFHSCLISRTYALETNIEAGGCNIRLVLPIQIAMEPWEQTHPYLELDSTDTAHQQGRK